MKNWIGYSIDIFCAVVFIIALLHLQWGMILALAFMGAMAIVLGLSMNAEIEKATSKHSLYRTPNTPLTLSLYKQLSEQEKNLIIIKECGAIVLAAAGFRLIQLGFAIYFLVKLL